MHPPSMTISDFFQTFIGLPPDSIYEQMLQAIDGITNTFDMLVLFTFTEKKLEVYVTFWAGINAIKGIFSLIYDDIT